VKLLEVNLVAMIVLLMVSCAPAPTIY